MIRFELGEIPPPPPISCPSAKTDTNQDIIDLSEEEITENINTD